MILVIHDHAPDGDSFAPDAFEGNVGRTIRLTLESGEVTHAQILAAEVVTCHDVINGGVNLTLEVAPWN